jgi:MFS family permease
VAAVGAATVLSFAILADYFPKELTGRANGALNLFHIAAAFAVQYATGVVLQHWPPQAGRYPEIAYQTAFALNLVLQVAAWIWFALPRNPNGLAAAKAHAIQRSRIDPDGPLRHHPSMRPHA